MKRWEAHLITAKENLAIAKKLYKLNDSIFFRWIAVILFYSAFHYLTALLLNQGKTPPMIHKDKRRKDGSIQKGMNTYAQDYLNGCSNHYHTLSNYCWNARYFVPPTNSKIIVDKCLNCAEKIAVYVEKILNQ